MLSLNIISLLLLSCAHSLVDVKYRQKSNDIHNYHNHKVLHKKTTLPTNYKTTKNTKRSLASDRCNVSTSISCENINGKDCRDLIFNSDKCYSPKLTFTFQYCNNSSDYSITLIDKKTWGKIEANKVFELGQIKIPPNTCRVKKASQFYDICNEKFRAYLNISSKTQGDNKYCGNFLAYEEVIQKRKVTPSPSITQKTSSPTATTPKTSSPTDEPVPIFTVAMKDPVEENPKSKKRVVHIILGTIFGIAGLVITAVVALYIYRKNLDDEDEGTRS